MPRYVTLEMSESVFLWQEKQFLPDDLHPVLKDDGLATSHPIYQPVNNPTEINQLFDSISYKKVNNLFYSIPYKQVSLSCKRRYTCKDSLCYKLFPVLATEPKFEK